MKHFLIACLWLAPALGAALPWLGVEDGAIIDSGGAKIQLRGMGLGNVWLPEGYMWKFGAQGDRPRKIEAVIEKAVGKDEAAQFWKAFRDHYITEADIARMAALGYNLVRPAINHRTFEMARLESLVAWCSKHGIYVLIDLHGAPGGQTGKNIDDSEFDKPNLFRMNAMQDEAVAFWEAIARRFKDDPAVLGYDLLNEPLPDEFAAYKNKLEPFYKRATRAIRAIDKRHIISVEGANWANDWSVFGAPFDSQLLYQFHKYWNDPDQNSIKGYVDFQKRWAVPMLAGEFGESRVGPGWYWATAQLFEDTDVHWCFWPWKKLDTDSSPYSIRQPAGWEKMQAIADGKAAPSRDEARKILASYLENIKLANCEERPEVTRTLFRRVPGRVEAENYGHLGEGKSYHVAGTQRSPSYRRSEPVQIENLNSSGFNVGWMEPGEWLEYEVTAAKDGYVSLSARLASPDAGKRFHFEGGGKDLSGMLEAPKTGAWDRFETKVLGKVWLKRGLNRLRLLSDDGGVNLDWLKFGDIQIEAEDYRAAHDTTPENQGGAYKPGEAVDIQELPGERRWSARLKKGDWLAFEINVTRRGSYRAVMSQQGGAFSAKVDGKALGALSVGKHRLQIHCDSDGLLDHIDILLSGQP